MQIQNNALSIHVSHYLKVNRNTKNKNLEQLSTGYRINRAGDDSAGLTISEKMRAQLSGLYAAQKNVKDGISLIKTAEGALQEVQDMLNRIKLLAVESANGTYTDATERTALNQELICIKNEIDRIASCTVFNGKPLLDGSAEAKHSITPDPASSGILHPVTQECFPFVKNVGSVQVSSQTVNIIASGHSLERQNLCILIVDSRSSERAVVYENGSSDFWICEDRLSNNSADLADALMNLMGPNGCNLRPANSGPIKQEILDEYKRIQFLPGKNGPPPTSNFSSNTTLSTLLRDPELSWDSLADGEELIIDGKTYRKNSNAPLAPEEFTTFEQFQNLLKADGIHVTNTGSTLKFEKGNPILLQIGSTISAHDQIAVGISATDTASLKIGDINLLTQQNAIDAIKKVELAITAISSIRGDLGSAQNRLEFSIQNLMHSSENLESAESLIRDTDIAETIVQYTKQHILEESAQAMLSQANQAASSVLHFMNN